MLSYKGRNNCYNILGCWVLRYTTPVHVQCSYALHISSNWLKSANTVSNSMTLNRCTACRQFPSTAQNHLQKHPLKPLLQFMSEKKKVFSHLWHPKSFLNHWSWPRHNEQPWCKPTTKLSHLAAGLSRFHQQLACTSYDGPITGHHRSFRALQISWLPRMWQQILCTGQRALLSCARNSELVPSNLTTWKKWMQEKQWMKTERTTSGC